MHWQAVPLGALEPLVLRLREQEYFLEGCATAYRWASPPGPDGMWSVKPTTTAHYKARLLVRRPTDPSKFNGTIIVEWLNVRAWRRARS